jgi:adenine C2-methylase RlmN of 23S rRNA A2503 and tRNA A37
MGEPLNNYDAVRDAVVAMTDPTRFGLSPGKVTISTVGVIPKIIQLARDLPMVNFALSLHAPTQELRETIVPSAKPYPMEKLMDAIDQHHAITCVPSAGHSLRPTLNSRYTTVISLSIHFKYTLPF